MNRGKGLISSRSGGYTIVETLIFLAVSAAMFVAAMALLSGQQNKAQFVNAVRDFEANITATANDIATGYYQNPGGFSCALNGSGVPQFHSLTPTGQGTNKDCILVGTVLNFSPGSASYDQYAMAGARTYTDSSTGITTDSKGFAQALPQAAFADQDNGGTEIPGVVTAKNLLFKATVECVSIGSTCNPAAKFTAVGFFAKLTGSDSSAQGNGIQTDVIAFPSVLQSDTTRSAVVPKISYPGVPAAYSPANINPAGITICLRSGSTDQHALIHLGNSSGNNLVVRTEILPGVC